MFFGALPLSYLPHENLKFVLKSLPGGKPAQRGGSSLHANCYKGGKLPFALQPFSREETLMRSLLPLRGTGNKKAGVYPWEKF